MKAIIILLITVTTLILSSCSIEQNPNAIISNLFKTIRLYHNDSLIAQIDYEYDSNDKITFEKFILFQDNVLHTPEVVFKYDFLYSNDSILIKPADVLNIDSLKIYYTLKINPVNKTITQFRIHDRSYWSTIPWEMNYTYDSISSNLNKHKFFNSNSTDNFTYNSNNLSSYELWNTEKAIARYNFTYTDLPIQNGVNFYNTIINPQTIRGFFEYAINLELTGYSFHTTDKLLNSVSVQNHLPDSRIDYQIDYTYKFDNYGRAIEKNYNLDGINKIVFEY